MSKPILYLLVGYPGAGKTSVAMIITAASGAVHLWADKARFERYGETYNQADSGELYETLVTHAAELLAAGQSVVFDTNFNYRRDRDLLRQVASKAGADTKLLWVQTLKEIAYQRAISRTGGKRMFIDMTPADFERVAGHLEPPTADEQAIIIDGAHIDPAVIKRQLGL
jgi:predicted kinase